jgi:DNA-binding response OmpR family regulator
LKTPPKILVVDDQPVNVKLLQRKLERAEMESIIAYRGSEAIDLARQHLPDVILLDVMMPEMDGFEVCQKLKEDEKTKDIPIIFITAKTSREGKLRGLGYGAADYITKPIDLDETLARINTQLRIQENHRENLELSRRLGEIRQQAAVGHVIEGIAHNLNNLLGVVVGYLDLLRASYDNPERLERSSSQLESGIRRMTQIVRQLTTVAEFDRVRKSLHSLDVIIENAIERFKEEHKIETEVVLINMEPDLDFETNQEMLEGAISRLLINAWESYGRMRPLPESRRLTIESSVVSVNEHRMVKIEVNDDGCGLPEKLRDSLFDPFVTTEPSVGRGMGLTIARHSLRSLGGDVRLESRSTGGTSAVILHPIEADADPLGVTHDEVSKRMTESNPHGLVS